MSSTFSDLIFKIVPVAVVFVEYFGLSTISSPFGFNLPHEEKMVLTIKIRLTLLIIIN